MQPVIYRRRRSAISRSEREWRVEDDALVTRGGSGQERRYVWKDIASVRLCAEPARDRPWRYEIEIQPKDQRKIVLDNAHYVSAGNFEDRSDSYTPFARAVLARLAVHNPKMQVLIGETPKRYFFLLLVSLLVLGGVAFTLIAVRSPLDALPFASLVKFAIVLAMLPVFWRWVIGAMPRGVAFDEIPDRALPPEPEEGPS